MYVIDTTVQKGLILDNYVAPLAEKWQIFGATKWPASNFQ